MCDSHRCAETWAAFIALETAEQHVHEARALYKRACGRKLEENGQVIAFSHCCVASFTTCMVNIVCCPPPIRMSCWHICVPLPLVPYKRLQRCDFWCEMQAVLCEAWVRFEREHGTAEEQLQAELKVEPIIAAAASAAAAAADQHAAAAAQVIFICLALCLHCITPQPVPCRPQTGSGHLPELHTSIRCAPTSYQTL